MTRGDREVETWGYGQPEMYTDRWRLILPCLEGPAFTLVDWGSDAGWFGVQVARAFPDSTVLSIDSGIMSRGAGPLEHRAQIDRYGLTNDEIVEAFFGPPTFRDLHRVASSYQLVLSVFHHMGDGFGRRLRSTDAWAACFRDLIRGSVTTLIELPDPAGDRETAHGLAMWLGDRDVEQAIRDALTEGDVDAEVTLLGSTEHPHKGVRPLFRVRLRTPPPLASTHDIRQHILARSRASRPAGMQRMKQIAIGVQHAVIGRRN
jgi:hypothetical protein